MKTFGSTTEGLKGWQTNHGDPAARLGLTRLENSHSLCALCTTSEASHAPGQLYVAAAGEELPPYFLFGTETDPPARSQQSFLANWWSAGDAGKMKQSTSFPVISFGTAAVTLDHQKGIFPV